jgi:hypothetical protein
MATTKNPSYFSNLKTPAANMAYGTGINVFDAVSKGASSAGKITKSGPTQEELEKQRNEEIVAKNLESAPQINFSQFPDLPQSMREKIMELVKNKGAERGYMTHMQKNSGDTDFIGKSELTQQIGMNEDLIKNHIPNQLKKLQAKFEGFNEDADNDMVSSMMSSEDKALISNIVSGNIIPDLDENGNMSFNGMTIDDLPGVELTNYEAGSAMLQNFTSAYDNGVLLTENKQALARTNFKQSLGKFSDNDLLSTGFEDTMSLGAPLLNPADYQDQINALRGNDPGAKIQAKKDLKLAIENAYMDKLNEQAQAGFDSKQSKNNPSGPPVDVEGGINTWHADTVAGGGTPTYQDWRLEIGKYQGKQGTPWEDGFELASRSTEGSEGGNIYTQGDKEINNDELMKIFGTTQAEFNNLSGKQQEQLFIKNKISLGQKESVAGKDEVYIIPKKMVNSTQTNKFSTGFKIDPSLNKDEILRIIKAKL